MAEPACPKPQKSGLQGLPADILSEVTSYLGYASHLGLSFTCRDLYIKVEYPNQRQCTSSAAPWPPFGAKPKGYNMADLLEIEMWPVYDFASYQPSEMSSPVDCLDYFACHLCLKIRSAGKFSNAMMKGKRGKLGMGTILERSQRFCIPCGVTHRRISPGTTIRFGGQFGGYGFVCRRCKRFESKMYGDGGEPARRICGACLVPYPPGLSQNGSNHRDTI